MIVAVLSQKGGVSKSTIARALAVAFSQNEWDVHIADLDWQQQTCGEWSGRREAKKDVAQIGVTVHRRVDTALKAESLYDLLLIDGRPASDIDSIAIAKKSNLVVLPSGTGLDDLSPQLHFANDLVNNEVPKDKIVFVINKATADADARKAKATVKGWGFAVIDDHIPFKTAYSQAHDDGLSLLETKYPTLTDAANKAIKALATKAIEKGGEQ